MEHNRKDIALMIYNHIQVQNSKTPNKKVSCLIDYFLRADSSISHSGLLRPTIVETLKYIIPVTCRVAKRIQNSNLRNYSNIFLNLWENLF